MVYLQLLTRAQVLDQFSRYTIVRYDRTKQAMIPVSTIPTVAFYEVLDGIQELELLD